MSENIVEILSSSDNESVKNENPHHTNDDSSSDTDYEDIMKRYNELVNKYNKKEPETITDDTKENETESPIETITTIPKKKPKRKNDTDEGKLQKKQQKEQEKIERQQKKDQQKLDKEKVALERKALQTNYKNLKPEEYIKFITVTIDSEIITSVCGTNIPESLQNDNITYKIETNLIPFTVIWSNKINSDSIENEEEQTNVILVILWDQFVKLINEKQLRSAIESYLSLLHNKKLSLGIYGLKGYFRYHKNKTHKSNERFYEGSSKISHQDVEAALIELQLLFGITHRMLEEPPDLSAMIIQFTKSIAQIPSKDEKQTRQEQMDWFASGDNKNIVSVDKNGNGLFRLWQQQLTQFPMAGLETAEAIIAQYPTPTSLIKAYQRCATKEEGERLLESVPIRRAAGPLANTRKIGFELSSKIYKFFTFINGNESL